ncbi:MAG TPA: hypothetical protein VIY66_02685 [Candidatus Acidoferrales bacterium]
MEDTSFIASGQGVLFFSPANAPDQNADLLAQKFDPYSIINCFDLFTRDAAANIAKAYEAGSLDALFPPGAIPGEVG